MTRTATVGEGGPAWLRWVTRASLALGLVALVVTIWVVGVDTIARHLRTIGPWFIVLLAIEAVATSCDGAALYLMTRGPGGPSWRNVCVAQFAGRAVNSVTPGANLGEALKVSLLARECSTQRIVAAVMYVAVAQIVVALALISAGSFATAVSFRVERATMTTLVVIGSLAAAVAILLVYLVRRGMLASLARMGHRLRLISKPRYDRWAESIDNLDARLRGELRSDHRFGAACLVVVAQLLQRVVVWVAIVATGYSLSVPQLIAVLSAGVVLNWVSAIVPMGVGVSEGGNSAMFLAIGAAPSVGVALALARRVNQIIFAALGFGVLAADRLAHQGHIPLVPIPQTTMRHAVVRL